MRVQVYVGKVPHDIECEPSWFFGQIKEQIFMITKVPVNMQRLVFMGKERGNREKLGESGVEENCKMMILTRGGKPQSSAGAPPSTSSSSSGAGAATSSSSSSSSAAASTSASSSSSSRASSGPGPVTVRGVADLRPSDRRASNQRASSRPGAGSGGSSGYSAGGRGYVLGSTPTDGGPVPAYSSSFFSSSGFGGGSSGAGSGSSSSSSWRSRASFSSFVSSCCSGGRGCCALVCDTVRCFPWAARYAGSVFYLALGQPQTGFCARIVAGLAFMFALWPLHLVPASLSPAHDLLDVLLLLPPFLLGAVSLIPQYVLIHCREEVAQRMHDAAQAGDGPRGWASAGRLSDRRLDFVLNHWFCALFAFVASVSLFFGLLHWFLQWVDPSGNILFILYLAFMFVFLCQLMRRVAMASQNSYSQPYGPGEGQSLVQRPQV